mmetsp:Transcript_12855/g.29003  ORF Transcript_12855/g.29003 Transcript_12855/m.29003 type:complete len:479 (+) Transcript_12855:82-1518(+)
MVRAAAALALLAELCSNTAWAQVYNFEAVRVPMSRTLKILHSFYVYSHDEAPERTGLALPQVAFKNVHAESTNPAIPTSSKTDYHSIQVSLMRYENFWNIIDPKEFCCTKDDDKALCPESDGLRVNRSRYASEDAADVYIHRVEFVEPGLTLDETKVIPKTGVYLLVLSNCGWFQEATISGQVSVKGSYGYLPGNEYFKIPFYGWLLCIYMVLATIWFFLSLRWWKELFAIQWCISAVIILGLMESLARYVYVQDWNTTGEQPLVLCVIVILASAVKTTFSHMLLLVVSLGWRVTRPQLARRVICKIQAISLLYIVLVFTTGSVRSLWTDLPATNVFTYVFILCLYTVLLLDAGIFCWVFTALSNLKETLADNGETEKLLLFSRLRKILVFAMTVQIAQIATVYLYETPSVHLYPGQWQYVFLLGEGCPHVLFLVVLAANMYLWAPHKHSHWYSFSVSQSFVEEKVVKDNVDLENEGA